MRLDERIWRKRVQTREAATPTISWAPRGQGAAPWGNVRAAVMLWFKNMTDLSVLSEIWLWSIWNSPSTSKEPFSVVHFGFSSSIWSNKLNLIVSLLLFFNPEHQCRENFFFSLPSFPVPLKPYFTRMTTSSRWASSSLQHMSYVSVAVHLSRRSRPAFWVMKHSFLLTVISPCSIYFSSSSPRNTLNWMDPNTPFPNTHTHSAFPHPHCGWGQCSYYGSVVHCF